MQPTTAAKGAVFGLSNQGNADRVGLRRYDRVVAGIRRPKILLDEDFETVADGDRIKISTGFWKTPLSKLKVTAGDGGATKTYTVTVTNSQGADFSCAIP